jgi:hypothetical protein
VVEVLATAPVVELLNLPFISKSDRSACNPLPGGREAASQSTRVLIFPALFSCDALLILNRYPKISPRILRARYLPLIYWRLRV